MFPRYHSTCIYRSQLWSLKSIFVAVSSRRVQVRARTHLLLDLCSACYFFMCYIKIKGTDVPQGHLVNTWTASLIAGDSDWVRNALSMNASMVASTDVANCGRKWNMIASSVAQGSLMSSDVHHLVLEFEWLEMVFKAVGVKQKSFHLESFGRKLIAREFGRLRIKSESRWGMEW